MRFEVIKKSNFLYFEKELKSTSYLNIPENELKSSPSLSIHLLSKITHPHTNGTLSPTNTYSKSGGLIN